MTFPGCSSVSTRLLKQSAILVTTSLNLYTLVNQQTTNLQTISNVFFITCRENYLIIYCYSFMSMYYMCH